MDCTLKLTIETVFLEQVMELIEPIEPIAAQRDVNDINGQLTCIEYFESRPYPFLDMLCKVLLNEGIAFHFAYFADDEEQYFAYMFDSSGNTLSHTYSLADTIIPNSIVLEWVNNLTIEKIKHKVIGRIDKTQLPPFDNQVEYGKRHKMLRLLHTTND